MEDQRVERFRSEALDEILGRKFPVLDKGFVRVVDYMGTDASVVQAARVSYGAGTKTVREDRGLIRYLIRNRHCYAPWMEVLTAAGWKRWDDCSALETFMVPVPKGRRLKPERRAVERFDCDEDLVTFESSKMSFAVTQDHRMWFKGTSRSEFSIDRAIAMPQGGHFDSLNGYCIDQLSMESPDFVKFAFVGFSIRYGEFDDDKSLTFRLESTKQIKYLERLREELVLEVSSRLGTRTVCVRLPDSIKDLFDTYTSWSSRSRAGAQFVKLRSTRQWSVKALSGFLDGLSDKNVPVKLDRPRVECSSASSYIVQAWETINAFLGVDAHRPPGAWRRSKAFHEDLTTLGARKEHFGRKRHSGDVFCATTSTGLLMVRGGPDKFAFVCGNSTPLEMCNLKLHVRVPMDCWRQWVR